MELHTNRLPQLIQAHLFAEGGTLAKRRLSQLTGADPETVNRALTQLSLHLENTGLSLITTDTEATLAVSKIESAALSGTYEKELGREIGDAGLEVLAIVLYRGPSTRAQIDYIRGVNTSSTIRTLLSRGLLTRNGNPQDGREFVYRPTAELLAFLGTSTMRDLPEYGTISHELQAFEAPVGPFGTEHERNETDNSAGGGDVAADDGASRPANA